MREKNETFDGRYLFKRLNQTLIKQSKNKKKSLNLNFIQAIDNKKNCTNQICFPSIGNILIGRSNFLYASSTCGLEIAERFCIIDHLNKTNFDIIDRTFIYSENDKLKSFVCFVCDSRQKFDNNYIYSHRIENVILNKRQNKNDYELKWWQSENGKNEVFIQLDLETEFILSNIYINFKSFPPASFVMEKSSDFGLTWQPIAYFATNCEEKFPNIPTRSTSFISPVCTTRYSQFDQRELIYRPLSGHRSLDPAILTKYFKITNLRFNFSELLMFGDHLLANENLNDDYNLKYFYAIREIRVMGMCSCNGHASNCVQMENVEYDYNSLKNMVQSKCQCEHNTDGNNCEKCLPLYNDLPWQAADNYRANECKECECNGHAFSCHFSPDRYMETNQKSGGVCDKCMHNTEGANCERCIPGYYHDKSLSFRHPKACKPCKCNIAGSKNFQCDSSNCECKANVEGEKCDVCKAGYWNLSISNMDGCLKCDVEVNGTINNLGCNKNTGELFSCKANVDNKRCDRCKPGYYGLSYDKPDGCTKCNCTTGLSYSDFCDPITGQCSCKPHVEGLGCDKIEDEYFCSNIDHLLFEAEDSILLNGLSQLNYKQDLENLNYKWTGKGYLRSFEGAKFKINFNHEYETGLFDIILRYNLKPDLEEVHIQIKNLGPTIDKPVYSYFYVNKSCNELKPDQNTIEEKVTTIRKYKTGSQIFSSYCFEKHYSYELEITIHHKPGSITFYNSAKEAPSILIDSLVLIPDMKNLNKNNYDKSLIEKFKQALNCREKYLSLPKAKSDKCDQLMCIVTATLFGLIPCHCDSMGSLSNKCEFFGGNCKCKQNVMSRKCDKCAISNWGFSEKGCQPCNCDSYGSINNYCDINSGECECKENSYGKTCDECLPGYFDPPRCKKCECNGFSELCHLNGTCINCKENTEGSNCERCKSGFYGSPEDGIPCKPCSCPGINGKNFAQSCVYDYEYDTFKCKCLPGYVGHRCDKCADFYYGSPLEQNGSCKKCKCNENIDRSDPLSCDKKSGKCLNCLYNTTGFNCERCKHGFYGNAFEHDCKACNCNELGTVNNNKENCDLEHGFCECLPNVIGSKCDECRNGYWNFESGKGCIECDCDTSGTIMNTTECEPKKGQCYCTPDRGGRRCDECPFGYWGNPLTGCKKCQCSSQGIESQQCDKLTGQCKCLSGIVGYYCDQCDRGTTGKAPFCKKCGECFENWDSVILNLNDYLENLDRKAFELYGNRQNFNSTYFQYEYDALRAKLSDLNKICNLKNPDLIELNSLVENLKLKISKYKNFSFDKFNQIDQLNSSFLKQSKKYSIIKKNMDDKFRKLIDYQESFYKGAMNSIKTAELISIDATEKMTKTYEDFKVINEENLKNINKFLMQSIPKYHNFTNYIRKKEISLQNSLEKSNPHISKLNFVYCGSENLDCTDKCGGIMCSHCATSPKCANSFKKTFEDYVKLNETFNQTYTKHEFELKNILTKKNSDRISYKHFNENLKNVISNLDLKFSDFEQKTIYVRNLISEMFNASDLYQFKLAKIEQNTEHSLIINLNDNNFDEEDFDFKLALIKEQEQVLKSNINYVKADIKRRNHTRIQWPNSMVDPEELKLEINKVINQTAQLEVYFKQNESALINETIHAKQIVENEVKINETLNNIEFMLTKLDEKKTKAELDIKSGEEISQFNLEYPAIEIDINKASIDVNLLRLREKIDQLNIGLNTLFTNMGNSTQYESILQLVELMKNITIKQNRLKKKTQKINELKFKNQEIKKSIFKTRKEILNLKNILENIKSNIKINNFHQRVCQ